MQVCMSRPGQPPPPPVLMSVCRLAGLGHGAHDLLLKETYLGSYLAGIIS